MKQKAGPHQALNPGSLDFGIPSLQNCGKEISVVYKPPSMWYLVKAAQTDKGRYPSMAVSVGLFFGAFSLPFGEVVLVPCILGRNWERAHPGRLSHSLLSFFPLVRHSLYPHPHCACDPLTRGLY